jgi:hypothetical protein
MSLIKQKTELESDLLLLDDGILGVAERVSRAIRQMQYAHAAFWSLPTERLLDVLNNDVERTTKLFAAYEALATALNAALDNLGIESFQDRAPISPKRMDIQWDADMKRFVQIEQATQTEPEE